MSEREPTKEPHFNLNIKGPEGMRGFEANRDNSSLYRHFGALAIYNHVYIDLGENLCTRIWKHDVDYPKIEPYMIANGFTDHNNLREKDLSKADVEAYDKMIKQQANDLDQIPEDWT